MSLGPGPLVLFEVQHKKVGKQIEQKSAALRRVSIQFLCAERSDAERSEAVDLAREGCGGLPGGGPPPPGVPGGVRGAVRASHQAKKSKDKTPGVFFHAAFDFDTPGP